MSQSTIVCRGITSGVRGLKQGTLRPDLVLLDDLQTAESAASPEQVKKLRDIINKDILNLSSKGKLTVIMTSTPICPEDLCSKIEADTNWRTTKYPAIIRWPRDVVDNPDGGLWARYYRIFDRENAENKPHDESRQFYLDNRKQMDEGAELFAPNRYKPEEHESGL